MKHVLFKNKAEHWKWCYENYFKHFGNFDRSPWSEEDRKIMQPFFDWHAKNKGVPGFMPPDVRESFAHYDKVRESGIEARERLDVVNRVEEQHLLGAFGFERKVESAFETQEEYDEYCDSDEEPELGIYLSYPCVMVYSLSASWDRIGDVTEIIIDYVELDEFKEVQDEDTN
jgi:hypothetical protein